MAACPKVQLNKEQLNTRTDEVIRHQTFKTNELPNCQFAAHVLPNFSYLFRKTKCRKERNLNEMRPAGIKC